MTPYEKVREMLERLGDDYIYVREIEDEAFSDGYKVGILHGIFAGGIFTCIVFATLIYI